MSRLATIVGATGSQGRSALDGLAQLDSSLRFRAITRNPDSDSAKALLKAYPDGKLELVKADASDYNSVVKAFAGSSIIFTVTDFFSAFPKAASKEAMEIEYQQGVNYARAAAETKELDHFLVSTLPDTLKISGGKIEVPHFQAKSRVDDYIRKEQPELLKKTTFLWASFYSTNFYMPPWGLHLIKNAGKDFKGVYVQFSTTGVDTPVSCIGDIVENYGKFIAAAVAQPEKTKGGSYVLASVEETTYGKLLETWSEIHNKTAQLVVITDKEYDDLFGVYGTELRTMNDFWAAVGDQAWVSGSEKVWTRQELNVKGLSSVRDSLKKIQVE